MTRKIISRISGAFAAFSLAISLGLPCRAAEPPPPRLPPVSEDAWTPDQRKVAAEITETFGYPPGGPFAVFIHRPGIADGAVRMYKDIKGPHSWDDPEHRLVNLAIIMAARHWGANLEWSSHVSNAAQNGITSDVIAAIRDGNEPHFVREDERVVYDVVKELLVDATLHQSTYDKAVSELGTEQLIGIVTATGFYSMIAMTLVAFDNSIHPNVPHHPLPPR